MSQQKSLPGKVPAPCGSVHGAELDFWIFNSSDHSEKLMLSASDSEGLDVQSDCCFNRAASSIWHIWV